SSAVGGIAPVRIHVVGVLPPGHVFAVGARESGQSLIPLELAQLFVGPLVVDAVVNAPFQAQDAELRLAGSVDVGGRKGYETKSTNKGGLEPHRWMESWSNSTVSRTQKQFHSIRIWYPTC